MPSTCTRLCSGEARGRGRVPRVPRVGRAHRSPRLPPRGLLTEKAAPVMNIIHSTFSLVLKFRSQLIAQPWRGPEHPNFALLQQSYSTFKYYSHFLFKGDPPLGPGRARRGGGGAELLTDALPPVVSKLVNRGYQPHLEDFLLRINFNSYYQDA